MKHLLPNRLVLGMAEYLLVIYDSDRASVVDIVGLKQILAQYPTFFDDVEIICTRVELNLRQSLYYGKALISQFCLHLAF